MGLVSPRVHSFGRSVSHLILYSRKYPSQRSVSDKVEPSSACRVLAPSLLACLHDFAHVPRWPNLENVAIPQRRMLADELYSMIHVPRLTDLNAAELFLGFALLSIGTLDFAVLSIHD